MDQIKASLAQVMGASSLLEANKVTGSVVKEAAKLMKAGKSDVSGGFELPVCRRKLQSAAAGASPEARRGMLLEGSLLSSLCADVIEDARAFCREKYGDSPEVRLQRVVASGE